MRRQAMGWTASEPRYFVGIDLEESRDGRAITVPSPGDLRFAEFARPASVHGWSSGFRTKWLSGLVQNYGAVMVT
jgi:hypothetical protein